MNQEKIDEIFFEQIEKQREQNPLIGAQLGAKEIYHRIFEAIREPDGRLNVDSLLLTCSSLAGMSCQMTVREIAGQQGIPIQSALIEIGCKNGTRYYMGDNLNYFLLENQYSVWSLAAGIYHHIAPDAEIPDIHQYAADCVGHLGDENYKIWGRFDEKDLILSNRSLWENLYPTAKKFCKTFHEIPILFGLALQFAIQDSAKVIEAEKCLAMALETALFTAKLDYQI
ncbi:MAG: hypothetical protein IJ644_07435 [Oscillospiraceae bacterium]|nr:hypothetical protein [Oscillospiraceae bacterium]